MTDQTQLLVQQTNLLEDIAAALRGRGIPWEKKLWSTADIAQHLNLAQRTVSERIVCLPSFPAPTKVGGSFRWYAAEVCEWIEEQRR